MAEIVEEVLQWFQEKLRLYDGKQITLREIADELGVNKGTVSRNRKRFIRKKTVAKAFYNSIHKLLTAQRLAAKYEAKRREREEAEEIRAQKAQNQADRQEQEAEANRKAEQNKQEKADRIADALKRQDQEQREASLKALGPWRKIPVAAGIVAPDDDTLYGDGPKIVADRVTDIHFVDEGSTLVALTPGSYRSECDHTSTVHRARITDKQRRQPTLVPKGEPRPEYIGYRNAFYVPRVLCHDARAFYGDDYPTILEWQRLTEECRTLVEGPIPLVVQPETVEKAARLLKLERNSRYKFEGSIFRHVSDPDAWLRSLSLRSIAPVAGDATVEGLKIVAKPVAVAAVGWAVWNFVPLEVWTNLWDTAAAFFAGVREAPGNARSAIAAKWTAAVAILDDYKTPIAAIVAVAVLLGLGLWWLCPRASDKEGALESRFIVVAGFVVAVPIVIFIIFQLASLVALNAEIIQNMTITMSESSVATP